MPGPYTVDASVFLNAFNPYETGYQDSNRLLARLQQDGIPIVVPTLLLPELAGGIARGRQDANLARAFVSSLSHLPHFVLVSLDAAGAHRAADIAAAHRLRGSDAVYASVALQYGGTLITLMRSV